MAEQCEIPYTVDNNKSKQSFAGFASFVTQKCPISKHVALFSALLAVLVIVGIVLLLYYGLATSQPPPSASKNLPHGTIQSDQMSKMPSWPTTETIKTSSKHPTLEDPTNRWTTIFSTSLDPVGNYTTYRLHKEIIDVSKLVEQFVLPGNGCPSEHLSFNNSCYFIGDERLDYYDAKIYCGIRKANLVHVSSFEENKFLMDTFKNLSANCFWVGFSYDRWSDDNSMVTTFYWGAGEPNTDSENCATFWYHHNFLWADVPCLKPWVPVCEYDLWGPQSHSYGTQR